MLPRESAVRGNDRRKRRITGGGFFEEIGCFGLRGEERIVQCRTHLEKRLPHFGPTIILLQKGVPEGLGVENAEILASEVNTLLPVGSIGEMHEGCPRYLCKEGNNLVVPDNANSPTTPHFDLAVRQMNY